MKDHVTKLVGGVKPPPGGSPLVRSDDHVGALIRECEL